jgi:hypothetical protein
MPGIVQTISTSLAAVVPQLISNFTDNRHYPSFFCHRGRVPDHPGPASAPTPAPTGDAVEPADVASFPNWFTQFLNDRQTRKPSAHTIKATARISPRSQAW